MDGRKIPIRGGVAAMAALIAGCAAVAPALTSFVMSFAQDLIATASVNYSPRYATHVESLLVALVNESTGLPVEGQLAQSGYRRPPAAYEQAHRDDPYGGYPDDGGYGYDDNYDDGYDDPYGGNAGYGDGGGYPGGDGYQDPYGGNGGYDDSGGSYPSGDEGYDDGYGDPYGDGGDYPGYDDPYDDGDDSGYDGGYDDGYDDTGSDRPTRPGGIRDPGRYAHTDAQLVVSGDSGGGDDGSGLVLRGGSAAEIMLDATVLVRPAGSAAITSVEDGAVLHDGNGNPARGDLLRFHARANCDCYLYVIGVDATGFVAQIFPDPENGLENPVATNRDYLFPGGNQWWGLDDQPGVEHVYFVASRSPRPDILENTRELRRDARTPAEIVTRNVQLPAVVPTRGLVRVETAPVAITVDGTPAEVVPERFSRPGDATSLTVTRWFHHE